MEVYWVVVGGQVVYTSADYRAGFNSFVVTYTNSAIVIDSSFSASLSLEGVWGK